MVSQWTSESNKHFSESQLISYIADNQLDKMWGNLDLNQGPTGYESAALTTELLPHSHRIYLICLEISKQSSTTTLAKPLTQISILDYRKKNCYNLEFDRFPK